MKCRKDHRERYDILWASVGTTLLLSCSGTGLLVGYLSLADVQEIVTRRSNSICGWIFALTSLVLSGFAIYLGRFLRWNSWDVLIDPTRVFQLLGFVIHPWSNARPLSVTFIFRIILALGYVSLRVLLLTADRQARNP